jgi:hypothetical protein
VLSTHLDGHLIEIVRPADARGIYATSAEDG